MNQLYVMLLIALFFAACATSEQPNIEYGKAIQRDKKLSRIEKDDKVFIEIIRDQQERVAEIRQYSGYLEKPQVTTYRYNKDNQLIERNYWEDYTDYYTYKNGRLTEMSIENKNHPEWKRRFVYHYDDKNRISKADIYKIKTKTGFILFEYDENNNTTTRKEYALEYPESVFAEYKFSYTDGLNPLSELYLQPLDIYQQNNPASSYFHTMFMASLPTTIFSEYQFDENGYPLSKLDTPKSDYQQFTKTRYTFFYR